MSSLVYELWKRLPSGPKRRIDRMWYELLSSFDPGSGLLFMNHGYAIPETEDVPDLRPEDEGDRFSIQLYDRVARPIDWRGLDGLEVSCGRGGGAAYVARYLAPRSLIGVDIARSAIRFCDRQLAGEGLSFRCGDAERLDFPDESFDVVLNVESSRSYQHPERFFREVTRVLRPGGHFLFADFRVKKKIRRLRAQLSAAGLETVDVEDLSPGIALALQRDAGRRGKDIESRAPAILRNAIRRFAHVDDGEWRRYSSGEKVCLRLVLRKSSDVSAGMAGDVG